LVIEVFAEGPDFELRHGGQVYSRFPQLDASVFHLELLVADLVLEAHAATSRLHAGCATISGRRVLLSGAGRVGKTTLLLGLLLRGAEVHCDEIVLLEGGEVRPFPKKFVIFDGLLTVVPELLPLCRALHRFVTPDGGGFRLFDPLDAGRRWYLPPGPVEHVFFLEPNFGGPASIEATTKTTMIQSLMLQTLNFGEQTGRRLRDLSAVVADAQCHRVAAGDPEETVAAVLRALE
jgi:hypothetical protein